jgi:ribonuclease Z
MALNDRSEELHIWGPVGTARSWQLAKEMCVFKEKFETRVHELQGGEIFTFMDMEISCTEVNHSVLDLAYRMKEKDRPGRFHRKKAMELGIPEGALWGRLQKGETISFRSGEEEIVVEPDQVLGPRRKGRSVVFSGDTGPSEDLVRLAEDCDVLVHEATFMSDLAELAHEVGHSTILDAADAAKKAKVGTLVLVHSSPRYTKDASFKEYMAEAMNSFDDVYVPEDLEQLEVTRQIDGS